MFSSRAASCSVWVALAWIYVGTANAAEPEVPETRLIYRLTAAARYNPVGGGVGARLGLRHRLYASDRVAFRDNAAVGAVTAVLTPALSRVGAVAEVSPASFATLFASWERYDYFGIAGFFQSFPSAASNTGPNEITRLGQLPAGSTQLPYGTWGQQVTLGATLAAQVGPWVARDQVRLFWNLAQLREGDRVFQDPNIDLVISNGGWAVANDLDVAWTDGHLTAGLAFNVQKSLFDSADYLPGERATSAQGWRARLGPSVNYVWAKPVGSRFIPSAFAQVQWWLAHPYRTGQESPAWMPWVFVGVSAAGDLL